MMSYGSPFGGGFDLLFSLFPILFLIVFALVIGTFVVSGVKGVQTWHRNNNSPRLTVPATVVAKRDEVCHHRHHDADGVGSHCHTSTTYYVTFQVDSGDRMEFELDGREYGLLVEGDAGMLTFQGTRYLGFERK